MKTKRLLLYLAMLGLCLSVMCSQPLNTYALEQTSTTSTKASKLSITTQPKSVTIIEGQTAKFTIKASGSGLKYKWQYSQNGGKSWSKSSASGYNTATLKIKGTKAANGRKFRCIVTNSAGKKATSKAVKLTVKTKVSITSQPKSATVNEGQTAKFTIKASGTGLKYKWQYSNNGGKSWSKSSASGYNTATLKIEGASGRNGLKFRCIVTDSAGNKVTSKTATLTVKTKASITSQPKSVTIMEGQTASFTVKAKGTGLKYKWQHSNDGGNTWKNSSATGYNTATLKIKGSSATNGLKYRCIITDNSGNQVTSNAATLTVKIKESINSYKVDLGNGKTTTVTGQYSNAYAKSVIKLLNEYRTEKGLNELKTQTFLTQQTDIRGYEIAYSFSHTRPNGESCFSLLYGNGYWGMGENIAAGYTSPEAVMNAWKNSPGHNANMLNPNYKYIGVSSFNCEDSYYGTYWVQMFAY